MITDIKDLSNVKVGEVVHIEINIEDFKGNVVPIIGTVKCNEIHKIVPLCEQCVFNDTIVCLCNDICYSKGRPDKKSVYFELIKPSGIKNN